MESNDKIITIPISKPREDILLYRAKDGTMHLVELDHSKVSKS